MITLLVCGSRDWTDYEQIFNFLKSMDLEYKPSQITILEGGCRRRNQKGADYLAGLAAKYLGYTLITCPADWQARGRSAGPIRNQQMLDKYKVDMVAAFHNDYENSKGTKDMCERAKKANIYTVLISKDSMKTLHSKTFTVGEAFTKEALDKWGISEEERLKPVW